MTRLICGKCKGEFGCDTSKGKHNSYGTITCLHCGRTFAGSKKESTGNLVGRKHLHIEYKNGDILK